MKLSNFQLTGVLLRSMPFGPDLLTYYAKVTVTTGYLWWKRSTTESIQREFDGCWMFTSCPRYCPEFQAEELEREYNKKFHGQLYMKARQHETH